MRFAVLALSLAVLSPARSADALVLTGLARLGGIGHAYLYEPAAGKHFSLATGGDYAGLRLIEVNFRQGWALVADERGTNRVEYARAGTVRPGLADPAQSLVADVSMVPSPRPRIMIPDSPVSADGSNEVTEPPSATGGLALSPAGTTGTTDEAASSGVVLDSAGRALGPRRRPTADELYKTRNGYGAYEELLRQRHQAEVLAARSAQTNEP